MFLLKNTYFYDAVYPTYLSLSCCFFFLFSRVSFNVVFYYTRLILCEATWKIDVVTLNKIKVEDFCKSSLKKSIIIAHSNMMMLKKF